MATLVDTPDKFEAAMAILETVGDKLVIDTETTGLHMFQGDRLVGIAIGPMEHMETEHDYYFTFRHREGSNLSEEHLLSLRNLCRGKQLLFHNASFDLKILHMDGFEFPMAGKILDSVVAAHLANELETNFKLKDLCKQYFGETEVLESIELDKELRRRKLGKGNICELPATMVAPYALADIRLTKMLFANRMAELRRWGLENLFYERCQFLRELIRTEINGIRLDADEVHRQQAKIVPKIVAYRQQLEALSGGININSPAQLCKWLGLESTDKDYLDEILARSPREDIQAIIDYRALTKANSTYFEPLLQLADVEGRIHTNYKIHGTVTHRLSSSEPNLQNCSRDKDGRLYSVRSCLVASPGCFLLEADYSSVEPRLAAHYSRDPELIRQFREGLDFHSAIARDVFKTQNVSKAQRHDAKTLGLGVLYGMGAYKAAVKLGLRHEKHENGLWRYHREQVWNMRDGALAKCDCSERSAEFCTAAGRSYVQRYYMAIPELEPKIRQVRGKAKAHSYIRNPLTGLVQRFDEKRGRHPHKAFNALIQSSAAEVLRRAFTKLGQTFINPGDPKITGTVHDSIIFEIEFSHKAWNYSETIKQIMEETTKIDVPLIVEMKVGYNLSNMAVLSV